MALLGWNYALFLPAAVGLVVLLSMWRVSLSAGALSKVLWVATGLWFLSFVLIVGFLFLRKAPPPVYVLQRDLGYAVGGSLALLFPFAAVSASLLIGRVATQYRNAAFLFSCAVALLALLVLPPIFFGGWIFGCVFSGYMGCM